MFSLYAPAVIADDAFSLPLFRYAAITMIFRHAAPAALLLFLPLLLFRYDYLRSMPPDTAAIGFHAMPILRCHFIFTLALHYYFFAAAIRFLYAFITPFTPLIDFRLPPPLPYAVYYYADILLAVSLCHYAAMLIRR